MARTCDEQVPRGEGVAGDDGDVAQQPRARGGHNLCEESVASEKECSNSNSFLRQQPLSGMTRTVSIFIALRTTSGCPAATSCPADTFTSMTAPDMGAPTSPSTSGGMCQSSRTSL